MTNGTTTALRLRDYQTEAIETVVSKAAQVRRQLIVMATGLGKTATAINLASYFIDSATQDNRVLWLTHRDELVQQTLRAIQTWAPKITPGVVKAEQNEVDRQFVVASIQTVNSDKRLSDLLDSEEGMWGRFGLVISDEHHHSPSPTWAKVLDGLRCGEPDGPLMVGLTATPNRADGVGLKATTDEIVFERDTVWAIGKGYLVPPKGITIDVDLSTVKSSGGDYQAGSLGDVLELEGAHAAIARVVEEHAAKRKTIIFTPTVKFADLVCAELVYAGFSAEMVSGETPLPDRQAMYARLRSGETQVIVNCMVLTEGFDEPSVDCVVVARPTKSSTLFIQMVGRGLRTYPGKDDCLVIALAGTERQKLATLSTLAGRTYEQAMKALEVEKQGMFDFAEAFDRIVEEEARRANMKVREVDFLKGVRQKIQWAVITNGVFAKAIPHDDPNNKSPKRIVVVRQGDPNDDQSWRVVGMKPYMRKTDGRELTDYQPMRMLDYADLNTAMAFADDVIRARTSATHLLDPKADWRSRPVTTRQLQLLVEKKIPHISTNLTAGMASDLLDTAFLTRIALRA